MGVGNVVGVIIVVVVAGGVGVAVEAEVGGALDLLLALMFKLMAILMMIRNGSKDHSVVMSQSAT